MIPNSRIMTDILLSARTLVLTNSDLLDCIFAALVPNPMPECLTTHQDKPSPLFRCTTVCRAFYEPVIRLLWRKLPAFFPLWQVLAPPNVKYPRDRFHGDKPLDYLHKILSARLYNNPVVWDHFLWHAAQVRDIRCSTYNWQEAKAAKAAQLLLIETVLSINGGKTVLPLLHSIQWLERAPADHSLIPFFTSTLRHATFSFKSSGPSDEEEHVLLFRKLRECSPYLQTIVISSTWLGEHSLDVGQRLVQELLSFDRLREIDIHRLQGSTSFLDLVTKLNLTFLSICDVTGLWTRLSSGSPVSVVYLREFIVAGYARDLGVLFDLVRFHALESAILEARIPLDSGSVGEVIPVVTSFCNAIMPATRLRSLDLHIRGSHYWGDDVRIAFRELIGPVLALRELRYFRFNAEEFEPLMEDADVDALVGAWPKMEQLLLETPFYPSHTLSLHAMHRIRTHFQNLEELTVHDIRCPVVDVHPIPTPPSLGRSSPQSSVPHLTVYGRLVAAFRGDQISEEAAEAVARYLLDLFPGSDGQWYQHRPNDSTSGSAYRKIFGAGPLGEVSDEDSEESYGP